MSSPCASSMIGCTWLRDTIGESFRQIMPEPRITKLPRNGPKAGQSVDAWLYGKDRRCQAERDAAQWTKPSHAIQP